MRVIALVLLASWAAWGQGLPPAPRSVEVSNTIQGDVRFTGQTDPLVVDLTAAALEEITSATNKGNCAYVVGNPTAAVGTTAANIPAVAMAGRTAIVIWNHSTALANALLCNAQTTATTTAAIRIEAGHEWWKWEGIGGGTLISCRCSTGTCTYGYQEEQCYQ